MEEIIQMMAQSNEYSQGFNDAKQYIIKQLNESLNRLKFEDTTSIYANAYNLAIEHALSLVNVHKTFVMK